MRPTLIAMFFCTIVATPSVAQNYYGPPRAVGAYNGHLDYDRLVPPSAGSCLSSGDQLHRCHHPPDCPLGASLPRKWRAGRCSNHTARGRAATHSGRRRHPI